MLSWAYLLEHTRFRVQHCPLPPEIPLREYSSQRADMAPSSLARSSCLPDYPNITLPAINLLATLWIEALPRPPWCNFYFT